MKSIIFFSVSFFGNLLFVSFRFVVNYMYVFGERKWNIEQFWYGYLLNEID